MHQTQNLVTGTDVFDDDAKTIHIDNVTQQTFFLGHLSVNAVQVFFAADDLCVDSLFGHGLAELFGDAFNDLTLAALALFQRPAEHAIAHRIEVTKAQVFELYLKTVDAKPVCDGRVDIEGLTCDASLLFDGHRAQCLHVMQTIGEFHEDYTNVLDHCEHHFAETLGLRLGSTMKLNLIELADAVDQQRDFTTELLCYFIKRRIGVLNCVVQNSCHNCL